MTVGHRRFGGAGYSFRVLIDAHYLPQVRAGPMS
jgi:hypothetical protein